MDKLLKAFILRVVIMAIWLPTVCSIEDEVCLWSTYDAICDENEVIQMEHALYGRMSVGRCIPENVGIMMGCQVDVLSYLDSVCSGRQSCHLRLPQDHVASEYQPCQRGLESYLQLKYKCVTVNASPKPCAGNPIPVKGTTGILANFVTGRTEQGSQDCPWEVRGSPGQRIRLTLHDYGVWTHSKALRDDSGVHDLGVLPPERSDICHIYARVTEGPTESSVTICGGEVREKVVYLSETEGVHIALTAQKQSKNSAFFLLRYEIIGCVTYTPPDGAVIVRYQNDISVTCPYTGSEWKVVCDGTRWQTEGNVTNCTETHLEITELEKREIPVSGEALFQGELTLSQGLVIAFFLSIAVLIAVIIMVIGIVVLRRRQMSVIESNLGYSRKEHFPMLTTDQREQESLRDRGYTTTAHLPAAVRPGTRTSRGKLPPLPLPPTSSFVEADHCNIHGSLSGGRCPRDRNQTTQSFMKQTRSNEWPNSLRSNGKAKNHFYHELDPEHTSIHTGPPLVNADFETDTLVGVEHVAPLPDVLFASAIGHSEYGAV